MTKAELLQELLERSAHCPNFANDGVACGLGRGRLSLSDVDRMVRYCSADFPACRDYRSPPPRV